VKTSSQLFHQWSQQKGKCQEVGGRGETEQGVSQLVRGAQFWFSQPRKGLQNRERSGEVCRDGGAADSAASGCKQGDGREGKHDTGL